MALVVPTQQPSGSNLVPTNGLPPPGVQAPPAAQPTPYGIDPNTGLVVNRSVAYQSVDPATQTVGGQLTGLLNSQNPYIQQAVAQSQAQSASRGLLNSSMAAGAGEQAAIAAALPIAQGNAQEYAAVGAMNQQGANQQLGAETAANAQIAAAGEQAGAQVQSANIYAGATEHGQNLQYQLGGQQLGFNYAQMDLQNRQFNAQLGQQGEQFNAQLSQNGQQFTQQLGFNIKSLESGQSLAAYQIGTQMFMANQQDYSANFQAIMMNPNMTPQDRQAALLNANQFYSGMNQASANVPAWLPPYVSNPSFWTNP